VSERDCDVLIVGGGLVGSALALALLQTGRRVAIVEAHDPQLLEQESFDCRVSALARGSRRILESLSLWPALAADAEGIRSIHVSEQGGFGAARMEAREQGVDALGYTIANRALGQALWQALGAAPERFGCFAPGRLVDLACDDDAVRASIELGDGRRELRSQLVVAADGQRSHVRRLLGIASTEDEYGQRAIVFNCRVSEPHAGRAFERFSAQGPLALLPITGGRMAVVWTLPDGVAREMAALPEPAFRRQFQKAFGYRLGRVEHCGERAEYALTRVRSARIVAQRCVLLGNAALSLHPVAGQSFNLALRDVAVLAELLAEPGNRLDAGAPDLLASYAEARGSDQANVALFTHSLVRLFTDSRRLPAFARAFGLAAFDVAPYAKPWLARRSMGLGGRLPRLARGLPVNDA
jgi:2-octaprenyl-6-methoxyphenol hydroxylase